MSIKKDITITIENIGACSERVEWTVGDNHCYISAMTQTNEKRLLTETYREIPYYLHFMTKMANEI
jgi:hypothetical protein